MPMYQMYSSHLFFLSLTDGRPRVTEHDFFERGEARAHKAELPCENVIAIGGTGAREIWMVRLEGIGTDRRSLRRLTPTAGRAISPVVQPLGLGYWVQDEQRRAPSLEADREHCSRRPEESECYHQRRAVKIWSPGAEVAQAEER
ncbi:hypothetical protein CVT26_008784 [Gymnopilus dilepis]|uniref:Uncharacterized protein n=1 Tax=Gymnopilus dilepis TaxID=231916 RepID=A0A409X2A8_9AGAR|nr:hypothetical protein CVT26_008784 [Gymnopilus dilepis]